MGGHEYPEGRNYFAPSPPLVPQHPAEFLHTKYLKKHLLVL